MNVETAESAPLVKACRWFQLSAFKFQRGAWLVPMLLMVGCASRPNYSPNGTVAIKVTGNNQRAEASVRVGNELKVELPAPDPAGYGWEISALDTRYLKQRTEVAPVTGAAGPWSVSLFALHPGRTRIRFVLVPPTKETEKPIADLEEVVITIE